MSKIKLTREQIKMASNNMEKISDCEYDIRKLKQPMNKANCKLHIVIKFKSSNGSDFGGVSINEKIDGKIIISNLISHLVKCREKEIERLKIIEE